MAIFGLVCSRTWQELKTQLYASAQHAHFLVLHYSTKRWKHETFFTGGCLKYNICNVSLQTRYEGMKLNVSKIDWIKK